MTKPTKCVCTQRGLRSAWASAQSDQSSLDAQWVTKDQSFFHADSEDPDKPGRMPTLIGIFAGRAAILLVFNSPVEVHVTVCYNSTKGNNSRTPKVKGASSRENLSGVFDQVRIKPACAATEAAC